MLYKSYKNFEGEWKWKNFTVKELSCSKGSCDYCNGEYWHDPEMLNMLQFARQLLGKPLSVSSAHRCVEHNIAVGGATKSQHLKIAFDLPIPLEMTVKRFLHVLHDAGFTTFGLYNSFIHVDNRHYKFWFGSKDKELEQAYYEAITLSRGDQ